MKAKLWLRLAAGCLLFFAVGHSVGHFTRHQVTDPRAQEVQKAMMDNKFDMFGALRSYDENYTGMSFNLIITLLMLVAVVWGLAGYAESYPSVVRRVVMPIAVGVAGFAITGFLYFFIVPAVTCVLGAACLGIAWVRLR